MSKSRSHVHPSSISEIKAEPSLILQRKDGEQIELTASHLEKWFASTELSLRQEKHQLTSEELDASTPSLATQLLGHFGLQSPQDVIKFLNSPAGEAITAMMIEELAEIAAIEERLQYEALAQQRLEKRILIFLLLGLMHRREAHAHRFNVDAQQDIDKHLKTEKEATQKRLEAAAPSIEQQHLKDSIAAYTEADKAMTHLLDSKLHDSKTIEKELADIEQVLARTKKKYDQYNKHLDMAYSDIPKDTPVTLLPIKTIEKRINDLAAQNTVDANEISKLLAEGKSGLAREILDTSNARNLQVAVLHDMLAVINGNKFMFTINGLPTTDFNEAEFILPPQKKIVLNNGKYYVMGSDQSFEGLSPEGKADSERAYLRLKPQLLGVKQLVEHNKSLEQQEPNERKALLSARSETMQQEILMIVNQITLIQAARAQAESQLKLALTKPLAKMTPIPSTSSTMPHPPASQRAISCPVYVAKSYREVIELMRASPSAHSIEWLQGRMRNNPDAELLKNVNKLTPGIPIPPEIMKQLVAKRNLGYLWMNQNTPDASRLNFIPAAPKLEPTAEPSKAPTPFSTRP